MVRANGREGVVPANLGVVPANLDPMDTLPVGADEATVGVDSGGFPLVFSGRLLRRSNVQGNVALRRRAYHRAFGWAKRRVVDHRAVAAVDALSNRPVCTATLHFQDQQQPRKLDDAPLRSEASAFGIGNPFRGNRNDVGDHPLL